MSLGTKSMASTNSYYPSFPPPPLVPIRDRGNSRAPPAALLSVGNNNALGLSITQPRYSCESDASSINSVFTGGSPPTKGLRPPPRLHMRAPAKTMPTIPGSPTDEKEGQYQGLSPLASRVPVLTLTIPNTQATVTSSSNDKIPEEHKRVPTRLPCSPLSPIRGFMAARRNRRSGCVPVPPPIVVPSPPGRSSRFKEQTSPSPALETVIFSPPPIPSAPKKRKTVWEGWWDIGLLERMNTIKRKALPK